MKNKTFFGSLLGTMAAVLSVASGAQAQTAPTNTQLLDKILASAKPGDKFVKNDDMLLSVEKLRAYRGKIGAGRHTSSAFYQTDLWPQGNVYYVFDASLLPAQRTNFIDAAREWETIAHLKFAPRTTQADYILVYKDESGGSFSQIGRVGGVQQMSLADWATKYNAAHEIAHALGVMHEQSRSNRDTYVSIDFTNISADKQNNFAIVANSINQGEYDFDSVMHYPQDAFAIDSSKPTIITKTGYTQFQTKMGQRDHISVADKKGMAAMYGPPISTLAPPNDNFVNAQVIEGVSGSVTGTNKLATAEPGEDATSKTHITASVWYRWRAAKGGALTITTKGSPIDTTLGVYTGNSVSTATQVAFNDDEVMGAATPEAGLTSSVTFPAQIGATYYIAVDSFSSFDNVGATGAIKLNWNQRSDAGTLKLSGSVKTAGATPKGVAGVVINLSGADSTNTASTATATTTSTGEYSIANLSAGNYNLRASKAGYTFTPTSLRVTLSGNSVGNNFTATAVSAANLPQVYVSDVTTREGNAGDSFITFNVSLSAPSAASATVNYTTVNGTATAGNDFNATTGTLNFAPGTTTLTVSVRLRPDTTVEQDETFSLKLSGAAGAKIVKETGVATLINDDGAAESQDSPSEDASEVTPQREKSDRTS